MYNITFAHFAGERTLAVASYLWQWDYGQVLKIEGLDLPTEYEVHFSNTSETGTTVTVLGDKNGVNIPDALLETGNPIFAFIYLHDLATDGETEYKIKIPVRKRPHPDRPEPSPEQTDLITQAITALNAAVERTDASAEEAGEAAELAQQAAGSAAGYAQQAAESAQEARDAVDGMEAIAQTAIGAKDQAVSAAQTATAAKTAAQEAATAAEEYISDAEEYAQQAAQSASDAGQSASAASQSAQSAAGSATSAGTSAQTATAKAQEASDSAAGALASAGAASAAATQAETKATEAAQSAAAASGSASAAAQLATAAAGSASDASDEADRAETVASSVSAAAAQIATNTADISDLKADLSELGTRVDNIEEAEGLHRYGVSGIGQSARSLTRLWDAVGMTAQVGTDGDNSNVINNFDDVTPFNRRKCVGDWYIEDGRAVFHVNAYKGDEDFAEDGSMGSFVAVECPRAYYYLKDGVLGVSAHQYPGWKPFDIFCHKHNENETIPYYYKNAYALAVDENGHAVSLPGHDNAQGDYKTLLDKARTYKNGELGNLPMLMPVAYNFYEWALFTVEFATQHCQEIMQGCAGLRYSNDDRATFVDASHVITNNYYVSRVVGECVAIVAANVDQNNAAYQATHRIVAITRCDENGDASATGTHQLIELEDLGKEYYEYDVTGATEYKFVARPYRTGDCNSVSTPSGSPVSNSDSYHPCKYRWHENPYANQFKTTMDLFNQRVGTGDDDHYLKWYLLDDPTQFASKNIGTADLETDAFAELDITTEHSNYSNGYIKSKKYSERYPDIWIPYETTGSSTTYTCDYAYLVSSHVVRSVRFGGSWYSVAYAGFSTAYAYNAPSYGNASCGGDLCIAQ